MKLPDKKEITNKPGICNVSDDIHARGWNACLEECKRLNAEPESRSDKIIKSNPSDNDIIQTIEEYNPDAQKSPAGLCSAHRDGEDKSCEICYPKKSPAECKHEGYELEKSICRKCGNVIINAPKPEASELEQEKKIRIKYQYIVYKICALFDNDVFKNGKYSVERCTIDTVLERVKELKQSISSPSEVKNSGLISKWTHVLCNCGGTMNCITIDPEYGSNDFECDICKNKFSVWLTEEEQKSTPAKKELPSEQSIADIIFKHTNALPTSTVWLITKAIRNLLLEKMG